MEAEQSWYYLHRSRQVGPYSWSELHSLLAKEVILPTTLVWAQGSGGWRALRDRSDEPKVGPPKSRQNWIVVALAVIVLFLGGITIVAKAPMGSELRNAFAIMSKAENMHALLDRIADHKQLRITEIAKSDVSEPNGLVEDRSNASPGSASFMLNLARPSLPSQGSPATQAALSPMEGYWRSIAYSDDTDLYESYLHRYSSGTTADIAKAKIKKVRKATKAASMNTGESGTSRKKESIRSSKTVKPSTLAKTTAVKNSTLKTGGRCWSGNIGRCRERCRAGEARACHTLKRIGG
jgi:hypothetical protein